MLAAAMSAISPSLLLEEIGSWVDLNLKCLEIGQFEGVEIGCQG